MRPQKSQKGGEVMKTLTNYKIEITFSTDKVLTSDELENLEGAILLQLQEPTDYDQNPENYETHLINYEIKEGN